MSFFNKILRGLGFEEDEEKPTKPKKKPKEKAKKEKLKPNYATFDLNEEDSLLNKQEDNIETKSEETFVKEESINKSASLDIIKVTNQVEVQNVVNKIKKGENVIINMLALSGEDLVRSLDFLTGAVYALDKTMQKVDNAIYIIQ